MPLAYCPAGQVVVMFVMVTVQVEVGPGTGVQIGEPAGDFIPAGQGVHEVAPSADQ